MTIDLQQTPSEARTGTSKHREAYDAYMKSARWERRKVAYYSTHKKICRACGADEKIHLHHHTYARMTHEHDDDLIPLCETCHDIVHRLHRAAKGGKTLTAVTREFIKFHGGEFHPPRRRMTKAQRAERRAIPPDCLTPEQAAQALGVDVSVLPRPKHQKRQFRQVALFPRLTVLNWTHQPPRWLREARAKQRPAGSFGVGDRVIITADSKALSWAKGLKGTVVVQLAELAWGVEIDDRPGSQLAVTTNTASVVI